MTPITFRLMTNEDLAELQNWYRLGTPQSAQLARYLEGPTPDWIAHVTTQDDANAWSVIMDGEMVAHIQCDDWEPNEAALSLAVKPSRFGQGIATAALSQFIAEKLSTRSKITVGVEPSNEAALRLVIRLGFQQTTPEPDAEGYLVLPCALRGSRLGDVTNCRRIAVSSDIS